jgi:PAS domain S-box-containing protein
MAIREGPSATPAPKRAPKAGSDKVARNLQRAFGDRVSELEALNARLRAALEDKTKAQQAQAHSDAHFRASFESDAVGQAHYDPFTGATIRVNRAHARMLGYEPEELIGRPGREFTWPEDRGGDPYRRMMAGELETYSREKRYIHRDGRPVWGRVSASLVRTPDTGEPLLAVAVIEDIDDHYKAQMALAQAKQDLEAVVEERTAALAQRDLLLREVYHRVKNNLQIVDSMLLLQAGRLADPLGKAALATLRSRVYALGLVHNQLMGSQDLETFDVAPFLRELTQHLMEGEGDRGIRLRVDAAPLNVGLDFGIPLGLLVTELVTNSMKHAFPDRPGAIEVSLQEEGGEVVLQVADDGVGYDPATAAGGTLGGRIVVGLVRQLGASLSVSVERGVRTVVRMPAGGRS